MDRSLDAVFRPKSIAVIGAGRAAGGVGNVILRNLVDGGFRGKVFPVNPKADAVHSIKCYPSILDVPDPVDLAVIAVPSKVVQDVAEQCAKRGVKALCVITAGFREIGPEGAERERRLRDLCAAARMRLVGPNCMGVSNGEADVRMDATIAADFPRPGKVAFLSQSGAMGVSVLAQAADLGLGIGMFASIGNRADVSVNDLLAYWEQDPATEIVLMYLEGFGNPRHFIPLARRISRTKPIVCVKAGRTAEAAQAASSHTGALAGADVAVDALLEQTGVLRVDGVGEIFDVALALSTQPLPAGDRVAVVTNAGGAAVLAVDFLVGRGLRLAVLSPATQAALKRILVPEASVMNPVDMVAGAGAPEYGGALPLLLADPGVDLVITIFVPPVNVDPVGVARRIFEATRGATKPVLGCFMAREQVVNAIKELDHSWFPVYDWPEQAVRAAWHLVRARRLRDDDLGEAESFPDVDHVAVSGRVAAMRKIQSASPDRAGWLAAPDVWAVLEAAGIPAAPLSVVATPEEAVAAASRLGVPVALKLDGEAFLHKTEVGGVLLGLSGKDAVRAGAERLIATARAKAPGAAFRLLVQPMAAPGVELVLGARVDPVFGPVLMVGLGGVNVEIWKDVAFGVVPLTRRLAGRMLRRLKGFPLLSGSRGRPPVDVAAVETALLRLAAVVEAHPEILEVEVNPLLASPEGVIVVDARVKVGRPPGPPT